MIPTPQLRPLFATTALTALLAGLAAASLPAQSCGSWVEEPTPALAGATAVRLNSVATTGPGDVWAVGLERRNVPGRTSYQELTLVFHWDGAAWSRTPTPNPGVAGRPPKCELHDVHAIAPNDAWAVGSYEGQAPSGGIQELPLVLRWDGSVWNRVTLPPQWTQGVSGVDGVGGDLWLSHYYARASAVTRWDGSGFTAFPTPNPTIGFQHVQDVLRISATDAWAVGQTSNLGTPFASGAAFVIRWNGTQWTQQTLPLPGATPQWQFWLGAVEADAQGDVWIAVGEEDVQNQVYGNGLYAWNGSAFSRQEAPGPIYDLVQVAGGPLLAGGRGVYRREPNGAWVAELTLVPPLFVTAMAASGPCNAWAIGFKSVIEPLVMRRTDAPRVGERPGCSGAKADLAVQGTPQIGSALSLSIDDPAGTTGVSPGSLTAWIAALAPDPAYPCGRIVPGVGVAGAGIEVLVDLGSVIVSSPVVWSGPGRPARHAVAIPNAPVLLGLTLYTQGLLLDSGSPSLAVTGAADLTVGR